jgi:CheY-like chemotaxis protein/HPt (histidine-containing phosphotransfer) domain-containing protein
MGIKTDYDRLREKGCTGWLHKPIKQSRLFDKIAEIFHLDHEGEGGSVEGTGKPEPSLLFTTGLRILLAEDNPVNQKVAQVILMKSGYECDVVADGREALEALEKYDYDAVLMDVQMPVMDGLEATKAIRANPRWRQLPVIATTAHAMAGDKERCLEAGMDDYISKPINAKDLVERINHWISRATGSEEIPAGDEGRGRKRQVANEVLNVSKALEQVGGDRELLNEVLNIFVDNAPGELQRLREGVQEKDAGRVKQVAHTLKGAAANIIAEGVRKTAEEIERRATGNDFASMNEKVVTLEEELSKLADVIESLIKQEVR